MFDNQFYKKFIIIFIIFIFFCTGITNARPYYYTRDDQRTSDTNKQRAESNINLTPDFILKTMWEEPVPWKYVLEKHGEENWFEPDYNDSSWKQGQPLFGAWYPELDDQIKTQWTNDIWLRREFILDSEPPNDVLIYAKWDDSINIYINGVPAFSRDSWTYGYEYQRINLQAAKKLKKGKNIIAIYCHNNGGPGYVDCGISKNIFETIPCTGYELHTELEIYYREVKKFMETNFIPAGTLSISKGDKIVLSRRFGWADNQRKKALEGKAIFRLASNDKLITKAAIVNLVKKRPKLPDGKYLSDKTLIFKIFQLYGIDDRPDEEIDSQIKKVTIDNLINHNSGIFELPSASQLYQDMDVQTGLAAKADSAKWILKQTTHFEPGTQGQYCSSAYFMLRYIVELVSGMELEDYLNKYIFKPIGFDEVAISYEEMSGRHPNEIWYADIDAPYDRYINLENYLALSASSDAMVKFLRWYHLGTLERMYYAGKWKPSDNGTGAFFGGMEGTFSYTLQRRFDEVNICLIFNKAGSFNSICSRLEEITNSIDPDVWNNLN
ncbi:MAG: beta-lactamase family protein [Sedimentisphaerales bacterium]|nr:beta-lactamase family protein [Sedimentisphaerales bacterium]